MKFFSTMEETMLTPRDTVHQFFGSTSGHGFVKLLTSNWLARAVWLLLLVVAFVGFAVNFAIQVNRYLSHPVTTEIRYQAIDFKFPDITLCNNAPFSNYRFDNTKLSVVNSLGGLSYKQIYENTLKFWKVVTQSEETRRLARLSTKKYALEARVTRNQYDSVGSCEYRSKPCNYSDVHRFYHPQMSGCVTFIPPDRRLFDISIEAGLGLTMVTHDSDLGRVSGNRLLTQFIDYAEYIKFFEGYRAVVHEPGTVPDFRNNMRFAVEKNTLSMLQISMREVRTLKTPEQQCLKNPRKIPIVQNQEVHDYQYTVTTCRELLLQEETVKQCGCLSDELYIPGKYLNQENVPHCLDLPKEIFNSSQITLNNSIITVMSNSILREMNITELVSRKNCSKQVRENYKVPSSSCIERCDYYIYEPSVLSTAKWPITDNFVKERFKVIDKAKQTIKNKTVCYKNSRCEVVDIGVYNEFDINNKIRMFDLYSRVIFLAQSLKSTLYLETQAYPLETLFSNMGGLLGLWGGMSIVTLIEVFEFLWLFYLSHLNEGKSSVNTTH